MTRRSLTLLMTTLSLLISPFPCWAADADKSDQSDQAQKEEVKAGKPPSIEEMHAHRRTLREDLMFPSLKGIRGLAYGIPGVHPDVELDKAIEGRLKQLPILVKKFQDLEPGVTKPIDGFLQVKVLSAGPRFSVVELSLTQWCSLLREPDVNVRTITYHDSAVTNSKLVKETAVSLVNQFVIDYLKANSPGANSTTDKASDESKRKKG